MEEAAIENGNQTLKRDTEKEQILFKERVDALEKKQILFEERVKAFEKQQILFEERVEAFEKQVTGKSRNLVNTTNNRCELINFRKQSFGGDIVGRINC